MEQEVEWLYAFDVHCNSFFLLFLVVYVLQVTGCNQQLCDLKEKTGAGYSESLVVVDGCVVTSQGPGTALPFGLKLVELLVSREKAEEVAKGLLNTEVP